MSKQYIVNRHTTPSTPALDEVPNEKIRVFSNETAIDAALSSLEENEIVATEDGAESSTRIGNPLGTILAIHSNAVPYGYLPCNGVAFDEHQYPALYALLGDNHTPDLRECNLVGAGQSERTILDDAGHSHDVYTIGQFKDDQIQNIEGNIGSVLAEGSKNGPFYVTQTGISCSGLTYGHADGYGQQARFDASRVARAGTTTHGKNVGVNYVIKATSGLEETQQDYVLQSLLEADNYSTDEVATGKKWIDGKMIYRKAFSGAMSNGTTLASDVDTLVSQYGSLVVSSDSWGPFPRESGAPYARIKLNESNHSLFADFSTTCTCKIVIEYTKTTD
jgi:microcystin-dependent protein